MYRGDGMSDEKRNKWSEIGGTREVEEPEDELADGWMGGKSV